MEGMGMKVITRLLFNVGCIISSIVGFLHFFAPYSFSWYSYIPDAPIEIIQSINYVNFCFSLLLAGLSLILLLMQKQLFSGMKELKVFYVFFVLVWLSRVIVQIVWPWPSNLQLWLVIAFSTEFVFALIPMIYLLINAPKKNKH